MIPAKWKRWALAILAVIAAGAAASRMMPDHTVAAKVGAQVEPVVGVVIPVVTALPDDLFVEDRAQDGGGAR